MRINIKIIALPPHNHLVAGGANFPVCEFDGVHDISDLTPGILAQLLNGSIPGLGDSDPLITIHHLQYDETTNMARMSACLRSWSAEIMCEMQANGWKFHMDKLAYYRLPTA